MKKKNKYNIPWGWIAFISFVTTGTACYMTLTPGSARWWADIFIYGIPVFVISLAFWVARLRRELNRKWDNGKSPVPWWYGGL